jgi:dipeptidyl aminopeptidase/acylaminoacyl peptidase
LAKYKFIDGKRMGLQGQSWGGYQSAQLITMTNRYKAAMAGAPVSNMFSAYGGIRWGSGMSRQFQYERTQSRIGYTIWERPDLYQLNSPIFHLPKVQTPLLIMHNDNDGAVPWYQGIELYMGLRRLQKPVWLFNYNGDEHNLMVESHRRDLSIRMRQFFDYYLMGAEMPEWMQSGVKAVDK